MPSAWRLKEFTARSGVYGGQSLTILWVVNACCNPQNLIGWDPNLHSCAKSSNRFVDFFFSAEGSIAEGTPFRFCFFRGDLTESSADPTEAGQSIPRISWATFNILWLWISWYKEDTWFRSGTSQNPGRDSKWLWSDRTISGSKYFSAYGIKRLVICFRILKE